MTKYEKVLVENKAQFMGAISALTDIPVEIRIIGVPTVYRFDYSSGRVDIERRIKKLLSQIRKVPAEYFRGEE